MTKFVSFVVRRMRLIAASPTLIIDSQRINPSFAAI